MDTSTLITAIALAIILAAVLVFGLVLGAGVVWWLARSRPGLAPQFRPVPAPATTRPTAPAAAPVASPESPSRAEARRRDRRRLRELERELATRKAREIALVRRAAEISRRDRAELIALQTEIEADARTGVEKARLLRGALADLWQQASRLRQAEHRAHRLEVAVGAAMASMEHSKRAQLRASHRLARTRGRVTDDDLPSRPTRAASAGAERGPVPLSDAS